MTFITNYKCAKHYKWAIKCNQQREFLKKCTQETWTTNWLLKNSGTNKGLTRMKKRERKLPTIKIQKLQNLMGGWEVRQRSTPTKKTENSHKSCDLEHHTLAPRLPDVCEKNLFPFFCSSASGKQDFILKLWIYEIHIFELWNEELNVKKILAVINATSAVAKRKPKKKNPGKPDFFRLSFCNCRSCVNNCKDLLYI